MLRGGLTLVETLTRPEGIRLMGHAGWRGKVGFAPFLVHGHARGDFVQFFKFERPEEFIKIEIAVIALCRPSIGPEEKQLGSVYQGGDQTDS